MICFESDVLIAAYGQPGAGSAPWPNIQGVGAPLIWLIALSLHAASLNNSVSPAPETPASISEAQTCSDAQRRRASELCASWANADAAEESARWAFWQMWLSLGGFAGLLASLYFTLRATVEAANANREAAQSLAIASRDAAAAEELVRISKVNAEWELRAYLEIEKVEFIAESAEDEGARSRVGFRIQVTNHGTTPASGVVVKTKILSDILGKPELAVLEDDVSNISFIAPGDHCGFRIFFWPPCHIAAQIRESGKLSLELNIRVEYQDVFGKPRHIECNIQRANSDSPAHAEGSRKWS